jgi:hypothetical protein
MLTEPLVPVGSDYADIIEAYGMRLLDEAAQRFGTDYHDAKSLAGVLRPIKRTGEDGDFVTGRRPTKQEHGAIMRSLNARARVLHVRLEYLRQLEKYPQARARAVVGRMFEIKPATLRGYLRPVKKKRA